MSYDVSIGDESFNYTYNVSELFYDHIPDHGKGGGLRELHGATGAKACEILAGAFENLNRTRHELYVDGARGEPVFCAKYDAPNGWGSTVGGLLFLAQILAACSRNRRNRIHVG